MYLRYLDLYTSNHRTWYGTDVQYRTMTEVQVSKFRGTMVTKFRGAMVFLLNVVSPKASESTFFNWKQFICRCNFLLWPHSCIYNWVSSRRTVSCPQFDLSFPSALTRNYQAPRIASGEKWEKSKVTVRVQSVWHAFFYQSLYPLSSSPRKTLRQSPKSNPPRTSFVDQQ